MRKISLALALVLAVPSVALATDARIQSLGGAEKAWTVVDETNALSLPSTLLLFPNTVWADAGMAPSHAVAGTTANNLDTNAGFGLHLSLGPNTVLAFYGSSLSRTVSDSVLQQSLGWTQSDISSTDLAGDTNAIHNADHQGTIALGQRAGSTRLGFMVSVWGDSYKITNPEILKEERGGTIIEGKFGLGFDLARQNSFDLALGFQVGMFTDDRYQDGGMVTRLKGDTEWGVDLLARGIFGIPGGEKLIPYAAFGTGGGGVKWNQPIQNAPEAKFSGLGGVVGADLSIQPLEDVFVLPGLGLRFHSFDLEDTGETALKNAQITPFFGAAVDARVASWLSLRFGSRQSVVLDTTETEAQTTSTSDVVSEFTLGAGMLFGNVVIDLMLNPEFLTEGPNMLSGNKLSDGFATEASVKFTW